MVSRRTHCWACVDSSTAISRFCLLWGDVESQGGADLQLCKCLMASFTAKRMMDSQHLVTGMVPPCNRSHSFSFSRSGDAADGKGGMPVRLLTSHLFQ